MTKLQVNLGGKFLFNNPKKGQIKGCGRIKVFLVVTTDTSTSAGWLITNLNNM